MRHSARALALALALAGSPAFAQHSHGHSPYAGQQSRDIKALSEEDVQGLLAGAGSGLAKAAELNRYPGPMHVLEQAQALELSAAQRDAIEGVMRRHKAEARGLGEQVVRLERDLDAAFAGGNATEEGVGRLLARLGEANARLRGSHLNAHIATRAILTPQQVESYVKLRGYAP
jgi:Spy/CpxP family protein refolding chaperone